MPVNFQEFVSSLPSQGVPYDDGSLPLIDGDKVKIRPILSGDLRVVASTNNTYDYYYNLLSRVITSPVDMDLDKFLCSDAAFLIINSRFLGLGMDYDAKWGCANCGKVTKRQISLEPLQFYTPEDLLPAGLQVRNLEIQLSDCKLAFHLPTLADEKQLNVAMSNLRAKKKILNPDFDRAYVLAAILVDSFDGKTGTTVEYKFDQLQMLSVSDFDRFQDYIADRDTGLRNALTVECEHCSAECVARVALGAEFFRTPSKKAS